MFIDLNEMGKKALVEGDTYNLIKTYRDDVRKWEFRIPHTFKFKGVSGLGNYQDEYVFVDSEGHDIHFCPAASTRCGLWFNFLEHVEKK